MKKSVLLLGISLLSLQTFGEILPNTEKTVGSVIHCFAGGLSYSLRKTPTAFEFHVKRVDQSIQPLSVYPVKEAFVRMPYGITLPSGHVNPNARCTISETLFDCSALSAQVFIGGIMEQNVTLKLSNEFYQMTNAYTHMQKKEPIATYRLQVGKNSTQFFDPKETLDISFVRYYAAGCEVLK